MDLRHEINVQIWGRIPIFSSIVCLLHSRVLQPMELGVRNPTCVTIEDSIMESIEFKLRSYNFI